MKTKAVKFSINELWDLNREVKADLKSLNGAKRALLGYLESQEQSGFSLFVYDVLAAKDSKSYTLLKKQTKNSKTGAYNFFALQIAINNNCVKLAEIIGYPMEQLEKDIAESIEKAKKVRKDKKVMKNALKNIAA